MPSRRIARFTSCLAFALLALAPFTASAKDSPQNEKILKATDPFEGLAEAGLGGSDSKVAKAVKAAQDGRAEARALLSSENAKRLDQLFSQVEAALAKHDNLGVSLQGAELYKLLVSSLDSSALTIPKEVGLLDYCGFRINLLLAGASPDWAAIGATVKEANANWAKIKDRVGDAKLQKKMEEAQLGLAKSAQSHDVKLAKASTKENLDLVDDLEKYFSSK